MQTLKDVFQREDERVNLKNMAICTTVVILVVFLAFGLRGMHFVFQQSPTSTPTSIVVDSETPQ